MTRVNSSSAATAGPMAELAASGKTITTAGQAWRAAAVGWLGFLLHLLLQIIRGIPSLAQLLSSVGLRHPLLFSSSASSPIAFKPLPSEIPVESPASPPPSHEPLDKLTDIINFAATTANGIISLEQECQAIIPYLYIELPLVVLDLDETLICAYETSSLPAMLCCQAIEAGLKCFELECISTDKEIEGNQKVNHITVFERPGLHEFLQQTSEFADLVLFTAGLEGYARPLVDRIDVENKFSLRLYRPATVSTELRDHVKDLSCLSKDLCRTVIVDNNPFSFLLQPLNGIPCVPFSAGQPHDEQLMNVILPLLKHLSLQKDVRPTLHEIFQMPEWFQNHGIPPSHEPETLQGRIELVLIGAHEKAVTSA